MVQAIDPFCPDVILHITGRRRDAVGHIHDSSRFRQKLLIADVTNPPTYRAPANQTQVAYDTTFGRWGRGSLKFSGTYELISFSSAYNLAQNQEFTFEMWAYFESSVYTDFRFVSSWQDPPATDLGMGWGAQNAFQNGTGHDAMGVVYDAPHPTGGWLGYGTVAYRPAHGQWVHLAFCNQNIGGVYHWRGYEDANMYLDLPASAPWFTHGSFRLLGDAISSGLTPYIHVNDLRLTRNHARYTGPGFQLPQGPFPTCTPPYDIFYKGMKP
jgi:hypothetical protein